MSIEVKVEGVEKTAASIAARIERTIVALQKKVFSLELQLQSKIRGNLASGIGLKSRHGTSGLAGSVRAYEPTIEGTMITGAVEGGGGPFFYGRMWEFYGHKEIVPVTKKVLHFFADGKEVFTMRVSAQQPRPWMIPPFHEMREQIISELNETAQQAGNE